MSKITKTGIALAATTAVLFAAGCGPKVDMGYAKPTKAKTTMNGCKGKSSCKGKRSKNSCKGKNSCEAKK